MFRKNKIRWLLVVVAMVAVSLSAYGAIFYAWPKITLLAPDQVVENFRSMERIFPSRDIHASPQPRPLKEAPAAIASHYEFGGEQRSLEEFLQRSATTGFLVIQGERIVDERYFQGNTADSRATSYSVAKSFVATLVGIAWQEGLIEHLEDPISRYVPALAGSGFDGVPITDVLQMASGIAFTESYTDKSADSYRMFDEMFMFFRPMTSVIRDYGVRHPPGQQFDYVSINTQALGLLVEAVSGMSLSAYLEQKLWQPMGASADAKWLLDLYGTELAFWGLNASARDFARFGMLYRDGGMANGRQILSPDWIRRAVTPDKPFLQPGQINQHWGYQYQWWVPAPAQGDYLAIGIWGQMIYVNPAAGTVVVKTSADPEFIHHEHEAVTAFRAIAQGLAAQ